VHWYAKERKAEVTDSTDVWWRCRRSAGEIHASASAQYVRKPPPSESAARPARPGQEILCTPATHKHLARLNCVLTVRDFSFSLSSLRPYRPRYIILKTQLQQPQHKTWSRMSQNIRNSLKLGQIRPSRSTYIINMYFMLNFLLDFPFESIKVVL